MPNPNYDFSISPQENRGHDRNIFIRHEGYTISTPVRIQMLEVDAVHRLTPSKVGSTIVTLRVDRQNEIPRVIGELSKILGDYVYHLRHETSFSNH